MSNRPHCEICGMKESVILFMRIGRNWFLCAECNNDMFEEIDADPISNVQILIAKEIF
jgi:hypothetical protein